MHTYTHAFLCAYMRVQTRIRTLPLSFYLFFSLCHYHFLCLCTQARAHKHTHTHKYTHTHTHPHAHTHTCMHPQASMCTLAAACVAYEAARTAGAAAAHQRELERDEIRARPSL